MSVLVRLPGGPSHPPGSRRAGNLALTAWSLSRESDRPPARAPTLELLDEDCAACHRIGAGFSRRRALTCTAAWRPSATPASAALARMEGFIRSIPMLAIT